MSPHTDRCHSRFGRALVIGVPVLVLWLAVTSAPAHAAVGARPAHGSLAGRAPVPGQVGVPPALPNPFGGACDLPVVSTGCDVAGGIVGGVTGIPGQIADSVLEGLARWIATGAAEMLTAAFGVIGTTTDVDLAGTDSNGRAWFLDHYRLMAGIALGLMAPMLLLGAVQALVTQSGRVLWRAVANLPVATIGTVAAITIVQLFLAFVDQASVALTTNIGGDTQNFLGGIVAVLLDPQLLTGGGGPVGLFGVAFIAMFIAFLSFVVWLELVVRAAAIYLAVLFLPLGFATFIWPALSPWLRRLVETIVALCLSKLVIFAALGLAGSALAGQEGFGQLVAGTAMLLLAAFAPFTLFSLVPIASLATISALEGRGRQAMHAVQPRLSTVHQVSSLARNVNHPKSPGTASGTSSSFATGAGAGAGGASASGAGAAGGAAAAGTAAASTVVTATSRAARQATHTTTSAAAPAPGATPTASTATGPPVPSRQTPPPRPATGRSARPEKPLES